jgi:hypothetical protein
MPHARAPLLPPGWAVGETWRGRQAACVSCRVVSGRDGLYIFLFDDVLSRKCFNP